MHFEYSNFDAKVKAFVENKVVIKMLDLFGMFGMIMIKVALISFLDA